MNQVYVCSTYFHVYVSMLKATVGKERGEKSLLVINDLTPHIENLLVKLREHNFFDFHVYVPFKSIDKEIHSKKFLLTRLFAPNQSKINAVEKRSDITIYEDFVSQAEINLFPDLGLTPAYFILKYPNNYIRMIEEGEGAYFLRISKFKEFKRHVIFNTFIGGGLDAEIKEIEVQFPEKLNPRVQKKGKLLALRKMLSELSPEAQNNIIQVFMSDLKMDVDGQKKLLLITQPLSEDRHITEDEKIKLYHQLLAPYVGSYSIFIKPHPRELTDYSRVMRYPFVIIPQGFPLEMFDLLKDIRFELGITVCSSALYNMSCVDQKLIPGRHYIKKSLPAKWPEMFLNTATAT